jgi:hypothetical protein
MPTLDRTMVKSKKSRTTIPAKKNNARRSRKADPMQPNRERPTDRSCDYALPKSVEYVGVQCPNRQPSRRMLTKVRPMPRIQDG